MPGTPGLASTSSGIPRVEARAHWVRAALASGRLLDGRAEPSHDGREGRVGRDGQAGGASPTLRLARPPGLASTSSGIPRVEARAHWVRAALAAGRLVDGRAKPDHDGGEGRFIQGGW